MKTLLCLASVLVMGSVSLGAFDGFEDYAIGSLDGLGTATGGWASAWTASHSSNPITTQYMVAAGGSPDGPVQHLEMTGLDSSGYALRRDLDTLTGSWLFSFDAKIVGTGTNSRLETEILLEDETGQNGVQIKIGGTSFEMFILNNQYMTVQYGDGAYPTMKPLHEGEDWVSFAVEYDAATGLFGLFWEEQDGTMLQHGGWIPADDAGWNGTVDHLIIKNCKANGVAGEGMLFDNISVAVPEPATLALLGLGGLAFIRRKR